jgi:starvation-inducible outer membrane lipoprotein
MMLRALLLMLGLALAGCATTPPAAWERGNLAKPEMAWDPDAQAAAFRSHVYTSKEHATGGASVGGGGCGCSN